MTTLDDEAEQRAVREAELTQRVNAADAAVRQASRAPDGDAPDYVAWWQGIADAHIVLADAYKAALISGLWSTNSLMWTALSEANWHHTQEAKRTKHEADLASDRAQRHNAIQPVVSESTVHEVAEVAGDDDRKCHAETEPAGGVS